MTDLTETDKIDRELAALRKGEKFPWGRIAHLLDSIEQSGYWRQESKSFSEWVRQNSSFFPVRESSLWRYLSAGRFYLNTLQKISIKYSRKPTPLLALELSPEAIELLYKLNRIMPQKEFSTLALELLQGQITRAKVRSIWETYRPALGGRTARGRGAPARAIGADAPTDQEAFQKGSAFTALLRSGPEWTGCSTAKSYNVFSSTEIATEKGKLVFDAVAVLRETENDPPAFHGVLMLKREMFREVIRSDKFSPYCDRLWILVTNPPEPNEISWYGNWPERFGVISFRGGEIFQERQARLITMQRPELVKMLFQKTLMR